MEPNTKIDLKSITEETLQQIIEGCEKVKLPVMPNIPLPPLNSILSQLESNADIEITLAPHSHPDNKLILDSRYSMKTNKHFLHVSVIPNQYDNQTSREIISKFEEYVRSTF